MRRLLIGAAIAALLLSGALMALSAASPIQNADATATAIIQRDNVTATARMATAQRNATQTAAAIPTATNTPAPTATPGATGDSFTQGTNTAGDHWVVVRLAAQRTVGTFTITGTTFLNLAYTLPGATSQPSTESFSAWPGYWGSQAVSSPFTGTLNVTTRWLFFDMGSAAFPTQIKIDGITIPSAGAPTATPVPATSTPTPSPTATQTPATNTPVSPTATPTGAQYGTILWRGDFETNDFSPWECQCPIVDAGSAITIESSRVAQGTYAGQFTLNGTGGTNNIRTELIAAQPSIGGNDGQTSYLTWSMYAPGSDHGQWSANWNVIAQWAPENFGQYTNCSPPISITVVVQPDGDHLFVDTDNQSFNGTGCGAYVADQTDDLGPMPYDRWFTITVKAVWGDEAHGSFAVWVDGAQKMAPTTLRTEYGTLGDKLSLDIYRPDWGGQLVVYYDNLIRHTSYTPQGG
jgi:hypothetical protein